MSYFSQNYFYQVPANKKLRVIVHTDCKNEADDQFALAHHLMTEKYDVVGIIAGHFNDNPQEYGVGNTAKASYDEILKMLDLMGLSGKYPVAMGSAYPMKDCTDLIESEGADMIIAEALKDDPRPLYICCQGAITDIGCAILKEPAICEKMTVIWIGGGMYPDGCKEFNLRNDIAAANILFSSKTEVWQVPINVYKQAAVSLAELQVRVRPCGEVGRYLFEQMVDYNNKTLKPHWPHGETWGLGDQATVTLLLDEKERFNYDLIPAPYILPDMSYDFTPENRPIRVYHTIDARLTMEDFYAKLAINFGSK
ncbi:MAG: nucleoside hydrolase [Lachnospiraceae bacterium]|nr:nucleoside hydrolase [Lachnospiraceae bacterium]